MFRWLAVCLILCAGTFLLMQHALGEKGKDYLHFWKKSDVVTVEDPTNQEVVIAPKPVEMGVTYVGPPEGQTVGTPSLVVYDSRFQVVEKQEVASERDGILVFLGTEVRQNDWNDPALKKKDGNYFEEALGYLVVKDHAPDKVPADQLLVFPDTPGEKYRYRRPGEALVPDSMRVAMVPRTYRKLEVGDQVEKGDLLALVKPTLALEDLESKLAKFDMAESERRASAKTRDEAKNRFDGMTASRDNVHRSVSDDEWRGARLTWERYIEEEIAKTKARNVAERELNAALSSTLRMHEIRALCRGVVKVIYKNRGDAVKNLEPVMLVQNTERLRVEGVLEVQDTRNLAKGMTVSVEPTQLESPRLALRGHTQEVNCVAVSKDARMIVSGSEDCSLRIWNSSTGQELGSFLHPSPVRSVVCTGPGASRNLMLTGTANGSVRLFNLDNREEKPIDLGQPHQSAVTSVAFSPDGQLCLTAGEDRTVVLWSLKDEFGVIKPDKLHLLTAAHRSAVTAVQFIDATVGLVQFLTVGKDQTAQVWTMEKDKTPIPTMKLDQRSDTVATLNTDGQRVLIDQAGELRLRSLREGTRIEGRLRNPPGAAPFTTMALFAPDGKTILTNVASEGRLQLWRTPPVNGRGSELRQMVWTSGPVTCGTFATDNPPSFVVTGTHDQQVLIWNMPKQDEIDARLTARISLIEKSLDSSSRQVRVWAELEKPPSWVVPGGTATMVIVPPLVH